MTPAALGRRYAPLIVLAAVQIMLVTIAPSGPATSASPYGNGFAAPGASGGTGSGSGAGAGGSLAGGSAAGASDSSSFSGGSLGAGGGGTDTGTGGLGAGTTGGTGGGAGGAGATGGTPGQLFNCGPDGKTVGPTFYMPACTRVVPQAQNGGSTMPGVTRTNISFVYDVAQANAQVNAILATEGLAASAEQTCEDAREFTKEVNKRWDLYGRQFVSLNGPGNHSGPGSVKANGGGTCTFPFFQSQCSLTPPDPPCERAEADLIASMHPAIVIAPTADPSFYNQLAKDQIVVWGGETEPDSYHTQVAPFYWDSFESGTLTAQMDAEYWCKKLNGKRVQYAGNGPGDVMGFGGIGKPPPLRKIAVTYPATNGDPTYKNSVDLFLSLINGKMCQPAGGQAVGIAYQSDINTAEQQSTTIVAELKQGHYTDVMQFGDPIAPVFLTNTADSQGYHPEIMLSGMGLIDYDVLGQLYNQNVWRFAFGPSSLYDNVPFPQSDAAKAWEDAGNPGPPSDQTANLAWAYFNAMATSFQLAGPNANPGTIRNGLWNAPGEGGDQHHPLISFKGVYTGIQDMREVWWCGTQNSPINNHPGVYVSVNDPTWRHRLGQWPTDLKVFPNGPCPA
ncbi:MAG TPA: hypothetical protein VFW24_16785 [Acidimicrobiales bacterium]|nr:hypothetical protein [Acidimicrobiales bacterium]